MVERSESLESMLLAWADEGLRDLPWRRTRDPWAVLVSETMLQQTQVDRVVDRWVVFLERFPDPATCATEPAAEILREWAGLGYNRRALMLHRAAQAIHERHGGVVPSDLDSLRALPGVGPYTARAVRAFAFELASAPVDTNIGRVLARVTGRRLAPREAQQIADDLVPAGRVWQWNQAIMELGALVCTKRSPGCASCPVASGCTWLGSGPDPADGSAGVSRRQAAFEGSDRQLRGRVIDVLRRGPQIAAAFAATVAPDDADRGIRVIDGLVADGLVERHDDLLRLPGDAQSGPVSAPRSASIA
ncbi:MAG: A/G-specific adenine glycosylase [Acidimicrobiales bacterium]